MASGATGRGAGVDPTPALHGPQADYPSDATLHRVFQTRAAELPDALAVRFEDRQLSYAQLDRRSNQLARELRSRGVGPEVCVGVHMERSLEMLVALYGILKAGGAYVPLDPDYPAERLAFMLGDAAVPVLLTQDALRERLPAGEAQLLSLDGDWKRISRRSSRPIRSGAGPENLAYVIYTSGSTGRPKGVMTEHRAICNRLFWMQEAFGLGPDERVLQKTPFSFDVSVWELFWPLMVGAGLVMARPGGHRDGSYLRKTIIEQQITTLHFVPSMLQIFLDEPELELCTSLRRVICSGEALPFELSQRFFSELDAELHNLYGPTEAAVDVSHFACRPNDELGVVPIGVPVANTSLYILGEDLAPVPLGEPGELCIGGSQVARGYLRRPELSAERFVADPFSADPGARMYRTGDLARLLDDGQIECLGRIDFQVKVRGSRVELGEIESALLRHPGVRQAVVTARGEAPGEARLISYLTFHRDVRPPSVGELRRFLLTSLPDFMIPSAFVTLAEMPLMPNGKLDRTALPEVALSRPLLDNRYRAPATSLERFLAGVWQRVLEVEPIGVEDDFFELGGDSIQGAQIVNAIQEKLGEFVYIVALFEAPTICALAAYLGTHYAEAVSRHFEADALESVPPSGSGAASIQDDTVSDFRRLLASSCPALGGRPSGRRNPRALFVLAPPRSGSTLLRVMLGGHSRLFAPQELELLAFETLRDMCQAFSGSQRYWIEGALRTLMEIEGCSPQRARALLEERADRGMSTQRFYELLQRAIGERLLVDKTPSYSLHPDVLERLESDFEEPLFVHLLRDPRATVASFEQVKLDQVFFPYRHAYGPRQLAELIWLTSHQNITHFLRGVPQERQLRIRFEDLVRRPEEAMQRVCGLAGLEFEPEMLRPYDNADRKMTDGLHALSRMRGDPKFHQYRGIDESVAERSEGQGAEGFGETTRHFAEKMGYSLGHDGPTAGPQPARGPRPATAPASHAQKRFWFLQQLQPDGRALNLSRCLRMRGALEPAALGEALQELVTRHEVLRTRLELRGDELVQVIDPPGSADLPLIELHELPESQREAALRQRSAEWVRRPFDLARGPLLRAALLRLSATEHVFVLVVHHSIADGWSLGLMLRELAALYRSAGGGEAAPEPPPLQYADYARWQQETLSQRVLERDLDYWRGQLSTTPAQLDLPADRPRPKQRRRPGARQAIEFSPQLTRALRALGRRDGVTGFQILLAAFQALLHRYTGETDIAVGVPVAGRSWKGSEALVGPVLNTLVMRTELGGDPRFAELLGRVQQVSVGAIAHQRVPFERLLQELDPGRHAGESRLFQVMLAFQQWPQQPFELPGLEIEAFGVDHGSAMSDLTLFLWEEEDRLAGALEYDSDLFDAETLRRAAGHLGRLLEAAVADPELRISELPLLPEAEERQLLVEARATRGQPAREICVHELVEEQVRRRPDAVAAVFEGRNLTYTELDREANRLAHYLRARGVGPGATAAICLERSLEMLVAVLGVLKAGGAYVPLDPAYPSERLAFMLEDCQARVVVTSGPLRERLPTGSAIRVCLDLDAEAIRLESDAAPEATADPGSLAYVIYTSGSTGRPKGVEIEHRSAVHFLESMAREPGLDARDTLLAVTTLAFDIAFLELFGPLSVGARVVLLSRERAADGRELQRALEGSGATVMQATPATWRLMLEAGWAGCRSLKLLCGGEALAADLARELLERCASLWNLYGPTEATVWCALRRVEAVDPGEAVLGIGRAIANTELYVLDAERRPLPLGAPGELYIGGAGLARGYHRRPELDAEKFVPHPFDTTPGARLYRTGDRVRQRPDGGLQFLGRIDEQVKLRGFRIELGEIEAVLRLHPAVRHCAVALRGDAPGDQRLAAYLVAVGSPAPDAGALRGWLAERLPDYMLPSAFVELEALPLTPNGKLDRRALPAPTLAPDGATPVAAAQSPLQSRLRKIWESVLDRAPIGIHDDFFEIGGHSLLALRLLSRVEEATGRRLPVAAIFEAPSIARMAALLEGEPTGSDAPRWPVLVPLQAAGSRPPFFFVAGSEHHPGDRLGPEQPVYRVQVQDLDRERPFTSVAEMAANCLESIRALQPRGPYYLGGHCFGGVVAYEIAQQLRRQGQQVALLAMLDSYAPGSARLRRDRGPLARALLRVGYRWRRMRSMGLRRATAKLVGDARRKARQASWRLAMRLASQTGLGRLARDPRAANYLARKRYQPEPYPDRVTVLACTERDPLHEIDPQHGWGGLARGGVEMHRVPGNHTGMYREPAVQQLVQTLGDCLRRARGEGGD